MPELIESTQVSLERADLAHRSPIYRPVNRRGLLHEAARSCGIHLSGVLRYIAEETGLLKDRTAIEEESLPLRMALGLAWEEFAVSLYPGSHWQPGEVVEEGVAMTCDAHSQFRDSLLIEEFKYTSKRLRSGEELLRDEWYWMQQGRGYCWGYEANYVRWHICHANGDYRGSGPIYMRHLVHLSPADVESTRTMILKNKERAIQKGYAE